MLQLILIKNICQSLIESQIATKIARRLVTSRKNVVDSVKKIGIDFVVQEGLLSINDHNRISILASATSCHHSFAKKVSQSIESGNVDGLYKRNTKFNAIKVSHWPEEISKFVLNETNRQSVPGEEQVSVRYGYGLLKYILLRSRNAISVSFKQQFPDCPFSISTMCEFPQNAVTPTTRIWNETRVLFMHMHSELSKQSAGH